MSGETVSLATEQVGPFKRLVISRKTPAYRSVLEHSVYQLGNTLIDSGSNLTVSHLIEELKGNPPERILLSHQHEDHAGGIAALREAFGEIPVYCPKLHVPLLSNHYAVPEYRRHLWGEVPAPGELIAYSSADTFQVGEHELKIIETPGHTPGHLSMVLSTKEATYVHTGDLYLTRKLPSAFFETSVPDMITSLRRVLAQGEVVTILPTHGRIQPDGTSSLTGLAAWYEETQAEIEATAKELGTTDYREVFREKHGAANRLEIFSKGELSRHALIRGVLDPVRAFPAEPIDMGD